MTITAYKMKKGIPLFIMLLFFNGLAAQERILRAYNIATAEEVIFKENKRVRIKTLDGVKISGRIKIMDHQTIVIKNQKITLSQIGKIKNHPIVTSILINAPLIYLGFTLTFASALIPIFDPQTSVILLSIPGNAVLYAAAQSPNFYESFKQIDNWIYQIRIYE